MALFLKQFAEEEEDGFVKSSVFFEIHFLPRPWVAPFHPDCHVCSNWRLFLLFFWINNVMLTNLALLCSEGLFSDTLFCALFLLLLHLSFLQTPLQ